METIVITGANRGIGLELTRQALASGMRVIATCRDKNTASDLFSLCSNPALEVFELEVTNTESVKAFVQSLAGRTIDVLLNNAGILGGDDQSLTSMDYSAWLHTFEVNTLAPFHLTTALLNNLKLSSRPRAITISSQMGSLNRSSTGVYAYRSSKAALNKVMQVMAQELKEDGIIICPIHPGWVKTDMGGKEADITVQQSASGLLSFIRQVTPEQSGRFWTWEGEEHPW
ncbi:SDR family oxidoreductase [Endozoicomonadaceae bacterium StTr2]